MLLKACVSQQLTQWKLVQVRTTLKPCANGISGGLENMLES